METTQSSDRLTTEVLGVALFGLTYERNFGLQMGLTRGVTDDES
jgi:hypothetical protein